MTATSGFNRQFEKYVDEWAAKMVDIWRSKMERLSVGTSKSATGTLYNTLTHDVNPTHDNISFTFKKYGYYVEAGAGREFGENGKLGRYRDPATGKFKEDPGRKPKPWLSVGYRYSRKKLQHKILEKTGIYFLTSLSSVLEEEAKNR